MITKLGSVCVISPIQVLWKRRVGYAWLTMPSINVGHAPRLVYVIQREERAERLPGGVIRGLTRLV